MRSLSPRQLREIRLFVDGTTCREQARMVARQRVLEQIDFALSPKKSAAPAKKRKLAKKKARSGETSELRKAVFKRAQGECEMCGVAATDLEHAFGRVRVPQKISNCLALCRTCHRLRTNNKPSAAHWWQRYAFHFGAHGYFYEARIANELALKHYIQGHG